jgi:hypothetical protein
MPFKVADPCPSTAALSTSDLGRSILLGILTVLTVLICGIHNARHGAECRRAAALDRTHELHLVEAGVPGIGALDRLGDQAKQRPLVTMTVALGIGMLIGFTTRGTGIDLDVEVSIDLSEPIPRLSFLLFRSRAAT